MAWFVPLDLSNEKIIFGDGNEFWKHTHQFTAKAAKDLGIELVMVDFNRNRFNYVERARDVASGKYGKIDAVIFYNYLNKGSIVLDIFERAAIPSISIITNFIDQNTGINQAAVGRPRALFKHWIAEFETNDLKAGRDLMHDLVERYQSENPVDDQLIKVIAIAGERTHSASVLRKKGLYQALDDLPNVKLVQLIEGSWSRLRAQEVLPKLLRRHGEIQIVWCANDELAMGAIAGLSDAKLDRANIMVGGVDWNSEALQAIERNRLKVSYGGHFLQGAYALTLLYDYLNGLDFAADAGVSFRLDLEKVDRSSLHLYKHNNEYFSLQQVNFLKMSRYYQKVQLNDTTEYSFNYLDYLVTNASQH
ncbi:sugar ABC transporter periplasmic protein [Catenovulum agarivorans DS-2]|uniref:Sugar ABC transporter periplasmic protein n=2 Tax=Catenovulum agarivorans TaxID=1172192 RepID=W7QF62_9ALTE|nr:sugar ABC transporter periplasmic protein [Catenovulum agarivorans DS-2]